MSSITHAVWVAEFESGDRTSTSVLHYGQGEPGMSYADFLGYLTGGRHLMRGQCVRLYARNVDLGLDSYLAHHERRAKVDPWYLVNKA